jgi:hypothetical protein
MSMATANTITRVPSLENGDCMTRAEFERRWEAMPNMNRAELIEGVVFMPSPVRFGHHGKPHTSLGVFLGLYSQFTPGTDVSTAASVRMDLDNEPQPDMALFIVGGNAWIDEKDYINGAPELVAEISASTVSLDLGMKFEVYKRNGVMEYLVWRVEDQAIDWFILRNNQYERLLPVEGILKSESFPGLWLDSDALLRGDHARVHDVLQSGLHSPEHTAFVAALQAKK